MWRLRVRNWGGAGRVIGCVDHREVGVSSCLRRGRRLIGDLIGRLMGHFIGYFSGRLWRPRVFRFYCALSCR
jgi:hypothetical protein